MEALIANSTETCAIKDNRLSYYMQKHWGKIQVSLGYDAKSDGARVNMRCGYHLEAWFQRKVHRFQDPEHVGSCDIKFPIRLEGLASRHMNFDERANQN